LKYERIEVLQTSYFSILYYSDALDKVLVLV